MAVTENDLQTKPERLLAVNDAAARVGVSRNTFLKQCKETDMWPDPVVSDGRLFWLESELEAAMTALPRGKVNWNYVPKNQRTAAQ